jgi:hypothetical protein
VNATIPGKDDDVDVDVELHGNDVQAKDRSKTGTIINNFFTRAPRLFSCF